MYWVRILAFLILMAFYGKMWTQLVEKFTVSQTLGTEWVILNDKWHSCTEMKMSTGSFPVWTCNETAGSREREMLSLQSKFSSDEMNVSSGIQNI